MKLAARIGAMVAAAMLVFGTMAWQGVDSASACAGVHPKTGDLNTDGDTNSLDALMVLFYDAGMMDAPDDAFMGGADVNCDTTVNALDASLILQVDAGLYEIRP